jgi:glutamate 5-kinase
MSSERNELAEDELEELREQVASLEASRDVLLSACGAVSVAFRGMCYIPGFPKYIAMCQLEAAIKQAQSDRPSEGEAKS